MSSPTEVKSSLKIEPFAFTLLEAAAYASVRPWFIQTAIWNGTLRARRAGKRRIILKEDLQQFLRELPVVEPRRSKQPKADLRIVAQKAVANG